MSALIIWSMAMWADSPLTSTDFNQAYAEHPMVQMAAVIEPGDFIPTSLLDFLSNK